MTLILLIHVFATVFMVGLIWFVQIVHYPLFASIGDEQFRTYEQLHQRLTTWVVGPAMLVELATGIMLLKALPEESRVSAWMGMGLIVLIWLATAILSVPAHRSLSAGFTIAAYQKLVWTNWIRTIAWTARGMLVLVMTYRCLK